MMYRHPKALNVFHPRGTGKILVGANGGEYGQPALKGNDGRLFFKEAMTILSKICQDDKRILLFPDRALPMQHHWDEAFGYLAIPYRLRFITETYEHPQMPTGHYSGAVTSQKEVKLSRPAASFRSVSVKAAQLSALKITGSTRRGYQSYSEHLGKNWQPRQRWLM